MKKALLFGLLAGFGLLSSLNLPLHAQTGAWFRQTLHPQMSGTTLMYCGESVAAVTSEQSPVIYFFDVFTAQWTTVSLKSVKKINKIVVNGNVAVAYTDSLLIGYSALVSGWDTLPYQGEVLPSYFEPNPFGAGENLAWFVTRTHAYIFDGAIGKWKEHEISVPDNYQSGDGSFWSRDNYAAVIIYRGSVISPYMLAYSMEKHAFCELDEGGTCLDDEWKMNYGFFAYRTSGDDQIRIGYSAFKNRFEILSFQKAPLVSFLARNLKNVKENTVYAFAYSQLINPPDGCRLYCHGFDTRSGIWSEYSWDYSSTDFEFSGFYCGGQVAMLPVRNKKTGEYSYMVYSGKNNSFTVHFPELFRDATPYGTILGGSTVTDFDTASIWFHSVETGRTKYLSFSREDIMSPVSGENYVCYRNYSRSHPDSMHVYAFNGNFDSLLVFMAPYGYGNTSSNENIVAFGTMLPNNTVQFYSSVIHNHNHLLLPENIEYPMTYVNGKLAFVNYLSFYGIYDANTNGTFSETCSKLKFQCGINVISLFKNGNQFSAYSSYTGKFHELTPPEGTYDVYAGTDIGLFRSLGLKKVYAFNGLTGDYVPLTDLTSDVFNTVMGGSTALVLQGNNVWAFSPLHATVSVPAAIAIDGGPDHFLANYPNPFSEATTVTYIVPKAGKVLLMVTDLRGQTLRILVSDVRQAGKYTVVWDGLNDAGKPVGSGIYLLSIIGSNFSEARKVFLIR